VKKKLLFSVTKKDCDWQYYKGSGPGGQKKNKTSSACRCIHRESGAVACSESFREQRKNREAAFKRMALTDVFKKWHKIECSRRLGQSEAIGKVVEKQMREVVIEVRDGKKWKRDN